MDHIGRVGKLVKDGFRGTIYSTPETKELSLLMLTDALKVMDGKKDEMPLYAEFDVDTAFSLWETIPYHSETKLSDSFSVYAKDAGHILGSSMYEFTYNGTPSNSRKIVFTGDSGNSPSPLLKNTETVDNADYLILDSVYGDRNHEPPEERDQRFKQIITETIAKGGALVIPAFSVERTQVMLYELNRMVESHEIPQVPVFLDAPLGERVTRVYARSSEDFNKAVQTEIRKGDDIFNFPRLSITRNSRQSSEIDQLPNPKIIIAGSGMSSGGRIVNHEMQYLPDPHSTILLLGYQALGTLGRRIQEKPEKVEIQGVMVPIRARIETITGYSSHKDSDSLVRMVEECVQSREINSDARSGRRADRKHRLKVFVVMGEPKSSMYLAQRLRNELNVEAVYPERGKVYELG